MRTYPEFLLQEAIKNKIDLTIEQTAGLLMISPFCLEELAKTQIGPRFYVDKEDIIRYRLADVEAFVLRNFWGQK